MPGAAITTRRDGVAPGDDEAGRSTGVSLVADEAAPDQQLGAEALGLPARQARQLGAADAFREAEEVLDHRRVRGLAARDVRFEHDRRETVGGRVNGCREACRTGAHDRQVVVVREGASSTLQASTTFSTVAPGITASRSIRTGSWASPAPAAESTSSASGVPASKNSCGWAVRVRNSRSR